MSIRAFRSEKMQKHTLNYHLRVKSTHLFGDIICYNYFCKPLSHTRSSLNLFLCNLEMFNFLFIPYRYTLYHEKYVKPYINKALRIISFIAHLASVFMIVTSVLEFGFHLTDEQMGHVNWLYFWVWIIYLIDRSSHLILKKRLYWKSAYSFLGWSINCLLILTLIPILVEFLGIDDSSGIIRILNNRVFHVLVLFVISLIDISDEVIRFLGQKSNPAFVMAVSFMIIILFGSGLLLMPRCIQSGAHITWVDSLFTSTSAVCVTGLTSVDISSTFTRFGQLIILALIQVGGLGVMTITSFFALFFMGNTTIYNQMLVREMVSSKSLASLWSTLINIFGFTAVLELMGAVAIFLSIHETIGMDIREEIFFSIFHSISAFCNAGFSTFKEGLSAPILMQGHCMLYLSVSFIIILGGIGYPVLVNFKTIVYKHLQEVWRWMHGRRYVSFSIPHLFDLNTKLVLHTTVILLLLGFLLIIVFEWNNAFYGMGVGEKLTHAFFNAVCPRTAGFTSVSLNNMCIQTIFIYLLLMWIGGSSQSTAGGIKVNAFAVAMLNIRAIIHGTTRVEFGNRELSVDSIRRANATVFVSVCVLAVSIFLMTLLEPHLSLKSIIFECVSALGTVGSSLGLTSELGNGSKLLVASLMFVGRVGMVTLAQGMLHQYKNHHYQLPQDNIIIS